MIYHACVCVFVCALDEQTISDIFSQPLRVSLIASVCVSEDAVELIDECVCSPRVARLSVAIVRFCFIELH